MTPAPTPTAPPPRAPAHPAAALRIVPYTASEIEKARAFNQRMVAGHAPTDFVLPDRPNDPAASSDEAVISWTKYLAMEGTAGEVRGGFLLMRQRGWLNGRAVTAANYQAPVSEGILDKRFGMVGLHMLRYVERQYPLAFVVGMGAADRPLPRLLSAAGWKLRPVPFLFRIVNGGRVLRELQFLQRRRLLGVAAGLAAASGAAALGAYALHVRGALLRRLALEAVRVSEWGEWADDLWEENRVRCSFAVARDRQTLGRLYPLSDPRYVAYAFRRGGSVVGWMVWVETQMRDHGYFGHLKVATILDAVGGADVAPSMVADVSGSIARGVDLIVTNQAHTLWVDAFRRAGFASAPSNYLLATSRALSREIDSGGAPVHVTRGDGDGRIHLM